VATSVTLDTEHRSFLVGVNWTRDIRWVSESLLGFHKVLDTIMRNRFMQVGFILKVIRLTPAALL